MRVPRFVSSKAQERLFENSKARRQNSYSRLLLIFSCLVLLAALLRTTYRWASHSGPMPQYSRWTAMQDIKNHFAQNLTGDAERCHWLARTKREPYSEKYINQTIDLKGPQYAYYTWENYTDSPTIEKWQIEIQRNSTWIDCRLVLKVMDGELYVWKDNFCYEKIIVNEDPSLYMRWEQTKELILLALEVFTIPDMDFALAMGDGETEGRDRPYPVPALAYGVMTHDHRPCFTMPGYSSYAVSLGDHQLDYFHECLRYKYPDAERINKAVWRGSTTGPWIRRPSDILVNRRISLAFLGRHLPDLLDAGVSSYVQMNESDAEVMELVHALAPKASYIDVEDFNRYAAVIDMDGNAWSERISQLMMANTPVIKQEATEWTNYLGHELRDGENIFFFKSDMSDLVQILEYITDEERFTPQERESHYQRMKNFAHEYVTQYGVIRSMAYSMVKLGYLSKWKVEMEEGYEYVNPADCCEENSGLPIELVEKIRAKGTESS